MTSAAKTTSRTRTALRILKKKNRLMVCQKSKCTNLYASLVVVLSTLLYPQLLFCALFGELSGSSSSSKHEKKLTVNADLEATNNGHLEFNVAN